MPKPDLTEYLQCPSCGADLVFREEPEQYTCTHCYQRIETENGTPLFTQPPTGLVPSERIERGADIGTPWRQANWRFLEDQVAKLDQRALILDVGAGRGDFSAAFVGRPYLALDVYPYPEVDIVCDLTQVNPLRQGCFDAIVLMNVLEHVYGTHGLVRALSDALKPGGVLILAIPFMVKIHQAPIDYVRFTHYALQRMAIDLSLEAVLLEGYYDPIFFLEEGIGNLRNAYLPTIRGNRRYAARLMLSGIQNLSNLLRNVIGEGECKPPSQIRSKAPTGYHLVFRKPG